MAVNKQMFDAVMKISRSHPGCKIDVQHSNTNTILIVDSKKDRRWVINNKGTIRRVVST